MSSAFREQEMIGLALRDQARVDALTRDCPKAGCGARVGEACQNLNYAKRGFSGTRTVWPHDVRTRYMQPGNRPADAIFTLAAAERRFRERPYLRDQLRKN